MILSSLIAGTGRMLKNKRMAGIFYLVNLLLGLMVMIPFRGVLNDLAGQSDMGGQLARGMNMDFLFEFLFGNSGVLPMLTGLTMIAAVLYGLAGLFLSGGAFSVFASGENFESSFFWGDAARYFGRFLRLFLWSLPVLAALYCVQFLENAAVRVIFGKDPYQYITFWGGVIRTGLGYAGLILYYLIFDYARIDIVVNDERKTHRALWRAVLFAVRNFSHTFGLALLVFLAGVAVLAAYNLLANLFHVSNVIVVLAMVLLQQCYIIFRMGLKLTLYASQAELFNRLVPEEPIPAPVTTELPGPIAADMQ